MTNEVKNVPEIRFPEFSGEWEENKLNNYLKTSKIKNTQKKYNKQDVLSVSGDFGIVNQIEFQGRSFAGASVAPYGIVETGDIVYTKSPLKSSPYGIIKVNKGESGIVSTLYAIYKIKKNVDANFVEDYFTNDLRLNKYLKPLVNKGAKNEMQVSDDNALIGDVIFPKYIEEQIKISKFFSKLDRQIELEEQKLEKLEEQKKGYMQNIFAQKLYFKDENGNKYPDWTIKKLNEVFEVSKQRNTNNEYSHKDVLSVSREHGVINQIKYHGRSYAAKTVENYKIVKPHDLIYTKSPLKGAPYGIFKVTTEEGIISPLHALYTSLNENITDFVSYYFEFNNITTHYLSKLVSKGAKNTINVTDEMALTGKILLPNSEKEVTQIVNFFNEIRELIMKQRNKIEGLKMRKQGFLQKMFV